MPQQAGATGLGPGEIAHVDFRGVSVSGHVGENKEYRPSFLLVGGPVGLAVTGAASLAHNAAKKEEARRAGIPRWYMLGSVELLIRPSTFSRRASHRSASSHRGCRCSTSSCSSSSTERPEYRLPSDLLTRARAQGRLN
jgi:hypothetical protein